MSKTMRLTWAIDRGAVMQALKKVTKKGTRNALDHLAAESKKQVPLDQGTLRASCYVDVSDDGMEGTVSYDTKYAVRQHEELSYNHQRGRKAKYLEDPLNDPQIQQNMLTLIQKAGEGEM